jgi:tRNA (guanine-N7-)-methyltransferase
VSRPGRLPLETLRPFLLDVPHPRHIRPDLLPTAIEPVDWRTLFGRDGPVEIEIGFGKGMFLCDAARAFPATNFFGIEIERKYALSTAGRLAKRSLTNVKVACTEACWFLQNYVRPTSVAAVHVYFPDPWWKKRHKKRKLFTAEFTREVRRVLSDDGAFHFATDVKDYFDESLALVRELRLFGESTATESGLMTNFERKYRAEGRPIYRTRFEIR